MCHMGQSWPDMFSFICVSFIATYSMSIHPSNILQTEERPANVHTDADSVLIYSMVWLVSRYRYRVYKASPKKVVFLMRVQGAQ